MSPITSRRLEQFTLQDNLLAEGYSFTPVVYYGALGQGGWRISAGQNFDLFAPRDPDTLPSGKLAATGNPGAYRPQLQVERRFGGSPGFGGGLQLAVSSPITTALPSSVDLTNLQAVEVVEDNGWPNVEARLSFGFGAPRERAGGASCGRLSWASPGSWASCAFSTLSAPLIPSPWCPTAQPWRSGG